MKLSFEFEGDKITYNLTYKKRHSISINVEENGEVNVVAPVGIPLRTVSDKVKGNAAWILSEIKRTHQKEEHVDQYMYLGKTYGIEIVDQTEQEKTTVKLVRGKFVVEGKLLKEAQVKEALLDWYISKIMTKVKERAKLFGEHFEKMPKKFEANLLKNKLWECDTDKITFDVNCGIGPIYILDCLVIEALCAYNDIEDSRSMLEKLIPEAENAQNWVKENSNRFIFR